MVINKISKITVRIATRKGGFYPFVISVDGMLVKEALVILANFSRLT